MLATFLVGRVFYEARAFNVDPDLWWHIKVGQNIVASHHWPTSDPFSYTVAGNPWMAYEWLGDVVLGTVARVGGLLGLDVFLFVWASVVMLALYGYTTLRSGNSKAGFVASGLLCSMAFATFNLRPQMLGLSVPDSDPDRAGAISSREAASDLVSSAACFCCGSTRTDRG